MESTGLNLGTALLLGLLGSSHCLGMCGGISAAIGMGLGPQCSTLQRLLLLGLCNTGRVFSYALMGALLGLAAGMLSAYQSAMLGLRLAAGIMLILMGIYLAGFPAALNWLESAAARLFSPLQQLAGRNLAAASPLKVFGAGIAWGWLPCGLVYSTLIWAGSSANWMDSTIRMTAFGLGTIPAVLSSGLAASSVTRLLSSGPWRRLIGLLVIAFGVWTILLALQHSGHELSTTTQHQH